MTRSLRYLSWMLPGAAAALAVGLFVLAGWNALQAGMLPELFETAAQGQPMWFCH